MATKVLGSQPVHTLIAPAKKLSGGEGGKGRPSEGKMFPRGTGK
jgi:hypothetical protein